MRPVRPHLRWSGKESPHALPECAFARGDHRRRLRLLAWSSHPAAARAAGPAVCPTLGFSRTDYPAGNGSNYPPFIVVVGDLNADGALDLVVANSDPQPGTVSVFLNHGDGTLATPVNYGVGDTPRAVAIGDFNADGKHDLAMANSTDTQVSILLGRGDGTFQAARNTPAVCGRIRQVDWMATRP